MNLRDAYSSVRALAFRSSRAMLGAVCGGRIYAFGLGEGRITRILILNLDRQPQRLRRTLRELSRFRTFNGASLVSLAQRFSAVDARDARLVAATADVDPNYRLGDQLFVQPDARLAECFGADERVKMTRQEIAVARTHIEAWKAIAAGPDDHTLVLEDDIWFRRGAATAINEGWRAAVTRCAGPGGPDLLYLSYADAGGTAERADMCPALFRPKRGLWFLSGYVISRQGANILLRAMPVIGPVDMWINYRFKELGALALSSPAIMQRPDEVSGNRYSVLPYLARAGIVDATEAQVPGIAAAGPVLVWTPRRDREGLAMALSILGLRVRVFDGDERTVGVAELSTLFETFDALVDVPLSADALATARAQTRIKFVVDSNTCLSSMFTRDCLPATRIAFLPNGEQSADWKPLCELLGLATPAEAFPIGPPKEWRIFRDDRAVATRSANGVTKWRSLMDDSPWALLPEGEWPSRSSSDLAMRSMGTCIVHETMKTATSLFPVQIETFPGNLAAFRPDGIYHDDDGAHLVLCRGANGSRMFSSGAFASARLFGHGHFEAEIRAARGAGFVTGFFLHRDSPLQEIDVELTGDDPHSMLVNVYFNPGDDGTALAFGYRGSPCRINLGFDATLDFHLYAIEWRPGSISWSVDGRVVHVRVGWDPTPLPHLPMRLHANLWAPRSEELAGRIDESTLPSTASFRNVSVWVWHSH